MYWYLERCSHLFAATYYWLPKWCGRMYHEGWARVHFILSFIGVNATFFPMHFVGLASMPRRIPDYALQFTNFNMMSSLGAFLFGASQLLFVFIIVHAVRKGPKASAQVWDQPEGLEWTITSPAPYHSFQQPPKLEVRDVYQTS